MIGYGEVLHKAHVPQKLSTPTPTLNNTTPIPKTLPRRVDADANQKLPVTVRIGGPSGTTIVRSAEDATATISQQYHVNKGARDIQQPAVARPRASHTTC